MIDEIWKDINGTDGLYQISNLGRVKSFCRGKERILKIHDNGKGYYIVSLGRKRKDVKVHRLVAKEFIPNPKNKKEVNHIDGNTKNNSVNNLEWVTHSENCIHYTNELSQHNGQFKMKKVIMKSIDGNFIKKFRSVSEAVRWLKKETKYKKATTTNISRCCKNKRIISYGYFWEYDKEEC
jgi:hypothetical protein